MVDMKKFVNERIDAIDPDMPADLRKKAEEACIAILEPDLKELEKAQEIQKDDMQKMINDVIGKMPNTSRKKKKN